MNPANPRNGLTLFFFYWEKRHLFYIPYLGSTPGVRKTSYDQLTFDHFKSLILLEEEEE